VKRRLGLLLVWLLCALAAIFCLAWMFVAALAASPRAWRVALGFDQTANAASGGDVDELVSTRCWRFRRVQPYKFLRWIIDYVAALAGDPDHCRTSFEGELLATKQRLARYTSQ
jgi:hypothetical protein